MRDAAKNLRRNLLINIEQTADIGPAGPSVHSPPPPQYLPIRTNYVATGIKNSKLPYLLDTPYRKGTVANAREWIEMTQLEGFPAVSSSHGTWSSLPSAGCVSSPAPQQSPAPSSCQSIRCLLTGASKPAGIKDFAWFNFYTNLSDISVDLLGVLDKILARMSARLQQEKRF
jgi:hypothetical protein